ncbi:ATP-grasp domain-containing protein [Lacipirellula sp.]|uniref:ATP-grasp domain-containing protein n=1 Tax=Lacipirellula sp. TaxID=2691419 RepID=UPI003D1128C3
MHVFLYEWITGGGLIRESGSLPPTLLREGSAMATALAADFAKLPDCRVTLLRDMRLESLQFPGCEVLDIQSGAEWQEEFARLAAVADRTLVVAPEFDRILAKLTDRAADVGGRTLNASAEFIALTADKHRTAETLRQAGLPAPAGRLFDEGEPKLPADFSYPAVLKPVDGAGSQDTYLVTSHHDEPPAYAWTRRLEQFHSGRPASITAICGPAGATFLPPTWQRLSDDGRMTYLGGGLIGEAGLADRAVELAKRTLAALPAARGFVGIDLILGPNVFGDEDAVIEVNPRATTSYVGLRQAVNQNLAGALLDTIEGKPVELTVRSRAIEFAADGNVWLTRS